MMPTSAPICDNGAMNDIGIALQQAASLLASAEPSLVTVVLLSLEVSLAAVVLAAIAGAPLGAVLAICEFPGRRLLVVIFNALMGLPPVMVGLFVYVLLSRAGPLGHFGLLFTPRAMVLAQALLVWPIVVALSRQAVEDLWVEYAEPLQSLGASWWQAVPTLLWDARHALITVLLAGFGRAVAEVGAVMIVGGNIDGVTRVMTTSIALETSKGNLAFAMALGFVLLALVLALNALAFTIRQRTMPHAG